MPRAYFLAAVALLTVIAIARMFPAYTTLTQTYDEPFHIASGMEWLDKGSYTFEHQHPPLARAALAIGPYLAGLRYHSIADATDEGNAILFTDGKYFRNLTLARLGNVPFYILACAAVAYWAYRWFNAWAALAAVVLFTSLPPILGHAAVATLDLACAATVATALVQFIRWLEEPTWKQAALLGVALSLAFLSKFSSFLFLPLCFIAALLYLAFFRRDVLFPNGNWKPRVINLAGTAVIMFVTVWAGYRFSLHPLSQYRGHHQVVDKRVSNPTLRRVAYALLETPAPFSEFVDGVRDVHYHNSGGHKSYLLGEYRTTGWWYFFPVVMAVKTPIGFMVLAIAGIGLALFWRRASWQQRVTALFPLVILLTCLNARINLGVRHILPIFAPMAVLAGFAVSEALRARPHRWLAAAALLLVAFVVVDSALVHPDYLAYFNQFASRHPERVLCESDLDWGQDLHRLTKSLKAREAGQVAIKYFGTAPLDRVGLPPYSELPPTGSTTGYAAISLHYLVMMNAHDGSYGWLKQYEPVEKVGKSIYLYKIENAALACMTPAEHMPLDARRALQK